MKLTLLQIQQQMGGVIEGDGQQVITGVNALEGAGAGDISFAESAKYLEAARNSGASVLVVPPEFPELPGRTLLRTEKPRELFFQIMLLFADDRPDFEGIHASARIAESARLGSGVAIGENVVVRAEVRIGDGSCIDAGVYIGRGVRIGKACRIGPNVTLGHGVVLGDRVIIHPGTVVGGEGFGYVWLKDHHHKIPQLGGVEIGDDVEIGSNACIDRATFGVTRIGRGTKIDNLVQIAHNNEIGEHTIIVSQVGLSGSVRVGNRVTLAGQVGVADHVSIEDGATAAARTGISKNVRPGEVVWGAPNRPMKQVLKEYACIARLPRLFEQVRALAEAVKRLEKNQSG